MRVTASALGLLHRCAWSFRDDVALPVEAKSDESRRGDAFAAIVESAINGTPATTSLDAMPESREEADRLGKMAAHALEWLRQNKRLGWRAEVAFAYEPSTDVGRELPRKTHRDYSDATATEVCGTADLVYVDGEELVVADWKTSADGAKDIDASDQLEALALFAARAWGFEAARVVTLVVTEDGVREVEGESFGALNPLSQVRDRIRADLARIPDAEPVNGEWCTGRYCKAVAVCPTTQAALAHPLPAESLVKGGFRYVPIIDSPDHLAWMLQMRPMLRKALEQVDAAAEAYVVGGPVHTSSGDEIRQAYRTMPRMNQGALRELAIAKGASEEEVNACVRPNLENNGVRIYKSKKGRAA